MTIPNPKRHTLFMLACVLAVVVSPTLLIQNGTILDGTGGKPYRADIRIQGDRIIQIGKLKRKPSDQTINAKGLFVAPGFIDAHSHAAGGIEKDPQALSQLMQGITTAVVGQDGGWDGPLEFTFRRWQGVKPAINLAAFTGHGGIRGAVLGEDYKRLATPNEIITMQALVEEDMKTGALGVSSGLEYDPGYYSNTDELIALCRVASRYDGMYISHVRDEGDKALESFAELRRIAQEAQLPAQISHIKLATSAVWGKTEKAIQFFETKTPRITADVYPYTFWQSTLAALSSSRDWENRDIWVKALNDVGGAANVRLTSFTHEPKWVGRTLAQIAEMTKRDPIEIIQEILKKVYGPGGSGRQSVAVTAMSEADLTEFIANKHTMFCSDGAIGGSHPRGAGSFPRILGKYVREKAVISWPEAIRKMTSFPAQVFQLKGRGLLQKGKIADIVVFDPKTIQDRATIENPTALSVGIKSVIVSGQITVTGSQPTGLRGGKILRRGQ